MFRLTDHVLPQNSDKRFHFKKFDNRVIFDAFTARHFNGETIKAFENVSEVGGIELFVDGKSNLIRSESFLEVSRLQSQKGFLQFEASTLKLDPYIASIVLRK